MRISDWSSDVCSSDLMMRRADEGAGDERGRGLGHRRRAIAAARLVAKPRSAIRRSRAAIGGENVRKLAKVPRSVIRPGGRTGCPAYRRSEEHTSELPSLMRISYAVFCLKKKTHTLPRHPIQVRRSPPHRRYPIPPAYQSLTY